MARRLGEFPVTHAASAGKTPTRTRIDLGDLGDNKEIWTDWQARSTN